MVGSVGSGVSYSYLGQLQGSSASPGSTGKTAAGNTQSSATSSASNSATTAQSLASSLLSGSSAFTPEVLSLLQEDGSGSFDPVSSLLGGTSTNNALTGLYSSLYTSAATASQTAAKNAASAAPAAKSASAVDALIAGQTQASVAANRLNQQHAANAASANSYAADGVTKLVS